MHGHFFSQTLFVPLAWVLTGRQNKPRWNRVCKQACEYRHETHKLAPRPDEYASAGIGASTPSHDQSTQPSQVKVNSTTKTRRAFLQVNRAHSSVWGGLLHEKKHQINGLVPTSAWCHRQAGSHYQSKPVCYRREKLRRQHAGRKHEIAAFGISFSPARLHLASPVIGARVSETPVSRRQTICEYRPAKP